MRVLPKRLFSSRYACPTSRSICSLTFCVLTLSSLLTSAASGQAPSPSPSSKAPSQTGAHLATQPGPRTTVTPPKTARATDGTHQGIKINGYWKIDIHNPDGTLAKHLEFENSLTTPETLQSVIAGDAVSLGPSIVVTSHLAAGITSAQQTICAPSGTTAPCTVYVSIHSPGPCGTYNGMGTDCVLTAATNPEYNNCLYEASVAHYDYTAAACVSGLVVTETRSVDSPIFGNPGDSASLALSGSFTVGTNSTIAGVSTLLTLISPPELPAVSIPTPVGSSLINNVQPSYLTGYALPTAQQVTAGQVVNISVTLSYQ